MPISLYAHSPCLMEALVKICTVISLSGGQGKTTTTYCLARLLAKQGHQVLAVDCDPQANLTFFLGHDVKPDEPSLFEVLAKTVDIKDGIYSTAHNNLFILPADRGLFKISDYLASSGAGAFVLKQRLRQVKDLFDFVLVDVQPSRSQLCLTAVGAATHALIPVEANVKGVNSLLDTVGFLDQQSELEAFGGEIIGAIPFRDRWVGNTQTTDSRETIAAMKELVEGLRILPTIRESEQFKKALRQGCLLSDLGHADLQHPFEQVIEVLCNG